MKFRYYRLIQSFGRETTIWKTANLSMKRTMASLPPSSEYYYYELTKKEHSQEVMKFLLANFRFDEPLNRASKITEAELESCMKPTLERCFNDSASISARSKKTNELVGIMLNSVWRREPPTEKKAAAAAEENPDFVFNTDRLEVATIGQILNELHNRFWSLATDEKCVLHFEVASVNLNHRRRGIASTFMNWAEDLSTLKSFNATGIASEVSSLANQTLLGKRLYKTLDSIQLSSKKDPKTGKPILICDDGTEEVKLMFKKFV